jgi:hypothetical protein
VLVARRSRLWRVVDEAGKGRSVICLAGLGDRLNFLLHDAKMIFESVLLHI